jgi:hypothetical protein
MNFEFGNYRDLTRIGVSCHLSPLLAGYDIIIFQSESNKWLTPFLQIDHLRAPFRLPGLL